MDRNAEFNYILAFAVESSFENELSRDQLRCLWTAYCFHNNLDADTYEYDGDIRALWNAIAAQEPDSADWHDLDSFAYVVQRVRQEKQQNHNKIDRKEKKT